MGERQERERPQAERAERLAHAIKRFEGAFFGNGKGQLWDHQHSALYSVWGFLGESVAKVAAGQGASGAIVMPTGAGKTAIAAELTRALGLRTLILAPTVRIAQQHFEELGERAPDVPASLYYADSKGLGGRAIVATYQSAVPLFEQGALPEDIDLVIYDEAHRSLSPKRAELHGSLGMVELGLTATPSFNASRHIWNAFDSKIYEMGIVEAVELGILSPLRAFVVETEVDVSKVRLSFGNSSLQDLNVLLADRHLNVIGRNRAARDFYLDGFRGVPAVAFCITKAHAESFSSYVGESGVKATFVHSGLPNAERERRLEMFEDGSIDLIATRDVLIEGWDSKRATVELNLRPTYSRVVKTHMVGRVARARPGKEAGIVVEFQDKYREGQQPVLVHHVLEQIQYRQGGLVAAPQGKARKEESDLKMKIDVNVGGNYLVSFDVKELASIRRVDVDFHDRETLRGILASQKGVDFFSLPLGEFMAMRFSYPDFHGSGISLIHKAFGIPRKPGAPLRNEEDYRHFLGHVYEDETPDSEVLPLHLVKGSTGGEEDALDALDGRARLQRLMKHVERLQPQKREALKLRLGLEDGVEHTFREIGEPNGLTTQGALLRFSSAVRELRRWYHSDGTERRATSEAPAVPAGPKPIARKEFMACVRACGSAKAAADTRAKALNVLIEVGTGDKREEYRRWAVAALKKAACDRTLPEEAGEAAAKALIGKYLAMDRHLQYLNTRSISTLFYDKRTPGKIRRMVAEALFSANQERGYLLGIWGRTRLPRETRMLAAEKFVELGMAGAITDLDGLADRMLKAVKNDSRAPKQLRADAGKLLDKATFPADPKTISGREFAKCVRICTDAKAPEGARVNALNVLIEEGTGGGRVEYEQRAVAVLRKAVCDATLHYEAREAAAKAIIGRWLPDGNKRTLSNLLSDKLAPGNIRMMAAEALFSMELRPEYIRIIWNRADLPLEARMLAAEKLIGLWQDGRLTKTDKQRSAGDMLMGIMHDAGVPERMRVQAGMLLIREACGGEGNLDRHTDLSAFLGDGKAPLAVRVNAAEQMIADEECRHLNIKSLPAIMRVPGMPLETAENALEILTGGPAVQDTQSYWKGDSKKALKEAAVDAAIPGELRLKAGILYAKRCEEDKDTYALIYFAEEAQAAHPEAREKALDAAIGQGDANHLLEACRIFPKRRKAVAQRLEAALESHLGVAHGKLTGNGADSALGLVCDKSVPERHREKIGEMLVGYYLRHYGCNAPGMLRDICGNGHAPHKVRVSAGLAMLRKYPEHSFHCESRAGSKFPGEVRRDIRRARELHEALEAILERDGPGPSVKSAERFVRLAGGMGAPAFGRNVSYALERIMNGVDYPDDLRGRAAEALMGMQDHGFNAGFVAIYRLSQSEEMPEGVRRAAGMAMLGPRHAENQTPELLLKIACECEVPEVREKAAGIFLSAAGPDELGRAAADADAPEELRGRVAGRLEEIAKGGEKIEDRAKAAYHLMLLGRGTLVLK